MDNSLPDGLAGVHSAPMPDFDPVAYKRTTHEQWDAAAEAWHRWEPTLRAWLGPADGALRAALASRGWTLDESLTGALEPPG